MFQFGKHLDVIIFRMEQVVQQIISDPRYIKNIEYGIPRSGHPEGKVRAHIAELEQNVEKLAPRLSEDQYWKLKFLIHVHDTLVGVDIAKAVLQLAISSRPGRFDSHRRLLAGRPGGDEPLFGLGEEVADRAPRFHG